MRLLASSVKISIIVNQKVKFKNYKRVAGHLSLTKSFISKNSFLKERFSMDFFSSLNFASTTINKKSHYFEREPTNQLRLFTVFSLFVNFHETAKGGYYFIPTYYLLKFT
jgi:hypothetical protein